MTPTPKPLALLVLVGGCLVGCGEGLAVPGPSEASADIAESRSEAELTGGRTLINEAVSWKYTDMIGRSVEAELNVAGHLELEFIGSPVLLSRPSPAGKATYLQTAIATVQAPTFLNPSVLETRRFLLRLHMESGFQWGEKRFNSSGWPSLATVVDASLPDAESRFQATYDAATRTTRPIQLLAAHFSGVYIEGTMDMAGNVTLDTFHMSSDRRIFSDSAYHNQHVELNVR